MKKIIILACFILCFIIQSNSYAISDNNKKNVNPNYGATGTSKTYGPIYKDVKVYPTGQNPGGIRLAGGGCVMISTNGGAEISTSVSFAYDTVSFSISTGYLPKNSVNGQCVKVPNSTDYFRFYIVKEYKFELTKVEVYEYGKLVNTYKHRKYTLIRETIYPEKVK